MTVAELIEELRNYPGDMPVVMSPYLRLTPVLDVKTHTLRRGEQDEKTILRLGADVFDS